MEQQQQQQQQFPVWCTMSFSPLSISVGPQQSKSTPQTPLSPHPAPISTTSGSPHSHKLDSHATATSSLPARTPSNELPLSDVEGTNSVVNAFIECQKGSANMFKLDAESGMLKLQRVLHSSVFFPGDYGFIPQTLTKNGEALTVLVLSNFALEIGTLVSVRIVGMVDCPTEADLNNIIIAVVDKEPRYNELQDIEDIPAHVQKEVAHFFATRYDIEGPRQRVEFSWSNLAAALSEVEKSHNRWSREVNKTLSSP